MRPYGVLLFCFLCISPFFGSALVSKSDIFCDGMSFILRFGEFLAQKADFLLTRKWNYVIIYKT